ncbi:MAG: purine-binding chemotaxis protein CheW [Bacteroidales bacterium]|nr:purine-binding chemotaxis protein CheW [Bacteroidales bacterium]
MEKQIESFLSFGLSDENFAISVHKVLEVLEKQKVSRIPKTPAYIEGVINFRGEILPVIKTREKFNMPSQAHDEKYVIIVLELDINDKKVILGAVADEVRDVLEIDKNEIKDVPEIGTDYDTSFLDGMLKVEDNFLMFLNVDKIFSENEILQVAEITKKSKEKVNTKN